jgi:ATP-dependent protease Clp ATPase subunit
MLINTKVLACNFCGKTQFDVAHLVKAENNSAICGECAQVAMEVIAEEGAKPSVGNSGADDEEQS